MRKQYFNPGCQVDAGPMSDDGTLCGFTIDGQTYILKTTDLKRLHYAIACGLDSADKLNSLHRAARATMRPAMDEA